MIEHYPHFERTLRESLRLLVGEDVERRVNIGMAKDGSGVGGAAVCFFPWLLCPDFVCLAALCALQASKQLSESGSYKQKL